MVWGGLAVGGESRGSVTANLRAALHQQQLRAN